MASRVNTRFVILLAGALIVLFAGVAGMLYMVRAKSGERYVARGDAAMARGDYLEAERNYSIAVNKEQQNVEWLKKWREALKRKVPPTQQQYIEDFSMWVGLHRQLAIAQRSVTRAHRDYLDIAFAIAELSGPDRASWNRVISETETSLGYFGEGDPEGQVLRRYRGIARMKIVGFGLEVDESEIQGAAQDLEIALAKDPGDAAAAAALAAWHRREADRARARRDAPAEQRHVEQGRAVLAGALAASPRSSWAIVADLRYRMEEALRDLDPSRPPSEFVRARRDRLDTLKPALQRSFESLKAADPAELDFGRVAEFYTVAGQIDPGAAEGLTSELLDRAVGVRPDAVDLVYMQGRILQVRAENEQAIARLQRIVEQPIPPVSLDGVRLFEFQKQAVYLQAGSAIALAAAAEAGPAREEALRRADKFRDALDAAVPDRSPELLFIDAKRAIARDKPSEGGEKLAEYSRITGNKSPEAFEALTIRAQIASRVDNQEGLAEELYTKALEIRPEAIQVRLALGELQSRLQKYPEALKTFKVVLDQDPENAQAKERYAILARLTNTPGGPDVPDPVMKALILAEQLQRERRPEDAATVLERAMAEHNTDPRIVLALVNLKLIAGDDTGARAVLERGVAAHPEHATLAGLKRQLEASSSYEAIVKLIDEAEAPELEKRIGRLQAMRQYGKRAEADELLSALASEAPDDPRIIEARFVRALERKELPAAEALAERAKQLDLDRADGLTFLARIQIAKGDLSNAAVTLRQAVEQGADTTGTRRLLGQVLMELGRGSQAVDEYRAALRLNPSDRETIKSLVVALARMQQQAEALRVARESERWAGADPDFQAMLYDLEALVGDRRVAVAGRERLAARAPSDARNGAALVQLYIDDRQWAKARALLDSLRAAKDSVQLVDLDARWHADQGDLDKGKQVYADYIDKLGREQEDPPGPQPYIAFGEFLLRLRDPAGLAWLEKAAEFQGEKREADLYLADRLFALGQPARAEALYRAVLDAGVADPDQQVRARLIECLVQQGKLDEAEKRITEAGAAADTNLAMLVLRAAIAERRGDARRARELLDTAVERFPDHHLPYFRRALLAATDRAFLEDALADLDKCVGLRPDFWQALTARAEINFARGREADAYRDLRTAVESNPMVDDLRITLILELLRRGREQEAFDVAVAGMKLRPNDAALGRRLADLFAGQGLWNRAVSLYGGVWLARRDEASAAGVVLALLRASPPGLEQADAILASPEIRVDNQPGLLILRAMLRMKQQRPVPAEADAVRAYGLAVTDRQQLMTWHQGLCEAWPDATERLRLLNSLEPREPNAGWLQVFRAQALAADAAHRAEAIDVLEKAAAAANDPVLASQIFLALDTLYRDAGNTEKALDAAKRGLAVNDKDVILNNNAAAYLSERLGRPDEALPFALKAYEGAPGNLAVLDTLASVHRARKDWAKAEEVLNIGLKAAQTPADKAGMLLGLLQVRVGAGDNSRAREALTELRRHLEANPKALNDEQRKSVDDLERQIR